MDTILRDLRYALRTLARQPGFSIAVALTLALGIGANTAIFSIVNGVLLRHLPYPNDDQLMTVWTRMSNGEHETASMPDYLDWKAQNSSFSQMTAYANSNDNLAGDCGSDDHAQRAAVHRGWRGAGVGATPGESAALGSVRRRPELAAARSAR
jgi:hypothetical protein